MKFIDASPKSRTSLKETSRDSNNKECMTESNITVINFDDAKARYMSRFKPSENMKSVDALARGEDDIPYMIEFKNGNIDGADIRSKIKDSVLILCDLCGKRIEDARNEIVFVLVINLSKVTIHPQEQIAIAKANLSGIACKFCGLNKSAGFLVKKVLIFDKDELEIKLLPKLTDV